jgi:hypothetical protein
MMKFSHDSFSDKPEIQNKENNPDKDGSYFEKSYRDNRPLISDDVQTDFEEEAKWENLLSDASDFEK